MPKTSAGIILYRRRKGGPEVLLVHPGGPFWVKKDIGAWSIPKGETEDGEEPLSAAKREFEEELGFAPPAAGYIRLGSVVQKSGKVVCAWAVEGDCDTGSIRSNVVKIELPPRSGKFVDVPEVDRAEFFGIEKAKEKINSAQAELLERLEAGFGDRNQKDRE